MFSRMTIFRFSIAVVTAFSGLAVWAQVKTVPLPTHTTPQYLVAIFPANVVQIDGAPVPAAGTATLPAPSIYVKEGGARVYLTAQAAFVRDSTGDPVLNEIQLTNFQTLNGAYPVDLVSGSSDGITLPAVAPGSKRAYFVTWESIRLETQSNAAAVITVGKVGASADNPPSLSANLRNNQREFVVASPGNGLTSQTLISKFQSQPGRINVVYEFDNNDPAVDFVDHASKLTLNSTGTAVVVDIGRQAPHRPEPYTIRLEFPAADLRGFEQPGFLIPVDQEFVSAEFEVTNPPPPSTRAKTEFFFDSTFTSIVNAKTRKRSNVGLFGLHIKPTLPMLTYNVATRNQSPWWMAFRPLLEADVDTQHIADSEAPNRIVIGGDFELGRDAGLAGANNFVQQLVWLNGVRYDSDRDFKLQTLYWHTELIPMFRDWSQTRERRLYQFRNHRDERKHQFPFVSAYGVMPSVGYDLGGFIKRDARALPGPTQNISRLFVKFSGSIEIKQLFELSIDDTYYFLENAARRRNRNYLETRLSLDSGALFNLDMGSLQTGLLLKFQRGELPPSFKPVNVFSIGFTVYH